MSKESEHFLFKWREAFMSSNGPSPTTRHILHVMSSHMDLNGGSCYPSITRIAKMTGYSRPCVSKHIKLAVKQGWLKKEKRKSMNNAWKRNIYHAVTPENIPGVVNEVNHVVNINKGVVNDDYRHSIPKDKKVVNEIVSNSSEEEKKNSSDEKTGRIPLLGSPGFYGEQEKYISLEDMKKLNPKVKQLFERRG